MSEKPSKTIRSKIPRFQGTRKKTPMVKLETADPKDFVLKQRSDYLSHLKTPVVKLETADPKDIVLKQRSDSLSQLKTPVVKLETADPKDFVLKQRTEEQERLNKLNNISEVSNAAESEKLIDVGVVPFEPDQQALESILTNTGIVPGFSVRASEMTSQSSLYRQSPDYRLSMWESLNEFKGSLKRFKEKMQQYEGRTKMESKAEMPNGILNKCTPATPTTGKILSVYYQPTENRMSMIESLEEHKKNMKIFREKMQNIDGIKTESNTEMPNGILNKCTPATPTTGKSLSVYYQPTESRMSMTESLEEHKKNMKIFREKMQNIDAWTAPRIQSQFSTPVQRQRWLGIRNIPSSAPRNNVSQKAWTESKENRFPSGKIKHSEAFSTSKKGHARLYANEEPSPSFSSASKRNLCYSTGAVKRPLLPSLNESEEIEKNFSLNCFDGMCKDSCIVAGSKEPATVCLSAMNSVLLNTIPKNTVFSSPLFRSADIIKESQLVSTSLTQELPLCQNNAVSSTECTLSCQKACTPLQSGHRFLTNVPSQGTSQYSKGHNTSAISENMSDSDSMKSVNLHKGFTENGELTAGGTDFRKTHQISDSTVKLPLSEDLNDCLKKLVLSSDSTRPVISNTNTSSLQHQSASVPKLLQQKILPAQITPSPAPMVSLSKTTISRAFTQKLQTTPLATDSGIFSKGNSSPMTPTSSFLYRPPVRTQTVLSCMKSKDNIVNNTHCLSMRHEVSSVKKLRWADTQN